MERQIAFQRALITDRQGDPADNYDAKDNSAETQKPSQRGFVAEKDDADCENQGGKAAGYENRCVRRWRELNAIANAIGERAG